MKMTDKQREARVLKRKRAKEREEKANILRNIIRAIKAEPLQTQRNIYTGVLKAIRATKARAFAKESERAKERGLIPVSLGYGNKAWVTREIADKMAKEFPWRPSDAELKACQIEPLANPQ